MTAFEYVAVDPSGKRKKGVLDADSARAARRELRERKLTLLEISEAAGKAKTQSSSSLFGPRVSSNDLVLMTRQLAMLIRSGTPVEEALGAVAAQTRSAGVRGTLNAVRASVTEGFRLSDALAKQAKVFNPLYRSMVAAGEASGDLGAVLERLAEFLENSQKMKRQAMAALIYPCVLAVVALGVVSSLMVFVVPKVVEQFQTLDQDLPALTRVVIAISEFMQRFGLVTLAGIVGGLFVFRQSLRSRGFRRGWHKFLLSLPVIGRLNRSVNAARFARTMGALVASGAPVMESLAAAKATANNLVIQDAVDDMIETVRVGGGVSGGMSKTGAFPTLLVYMVASGERSGELAAMFTKGAEYLESEFQAATTVALNMLEPGMIVIMAGFVAMIVLAIMMPILQLNSLAAL